MKTMTLEVTDGTAEHMEEVAATQGVNLAAIISLSVAWLEFCIETGGPDTAPLARRLADLRKTHPA